MKTLLLCAFLLSTYFAYGQNQQMDKTVRIISEASYIEINGTTNVNSFNCGYNAKLPSNTFEVSIKKEAMAFEINHEALFLRVQDFECPNPQMTHDFHKLLQYDDYPFIIFQVIQFTKGDTATVMIEMAGQSKFYEVRIETERKANKLLCNANFELNISDFGLEAPEKFFGMVKVNEEIEVQFKIELNIFDK